MYETYTAQISRMFGDPKTRAASTSAAAGGSGRRYNDARSRSQSSICDLTRSSAMQTSIAERSKPSSSSSSSVASRLPTIACSRARRNERQAWSLSRAGSGLAPGSPRRATSQSASTRAAAIGLSVAGRTTTARCVDCRARGCKLRSAQRSLAPSDSTNDGSIFGSGTVCLLPVDCGWGKGLLIRHDRFRAAARRGSATRRAAADGGTRPFRGAIRAGRPHGRVGRGSPVRRKGCRTPSIRRA